MELGTAPVLSNQIGLFPHPAKNLTRLFSSVLKRPRHNVRFGSKADVHESVLANRIVVNPLFHSLSG